jgi:FHA domain-containing protein
MILTLLAVSLNDKPLTQPITARFDGNGGSIGRADHNTLALPDPERFISRLQAEVVATGGGYLIRNVGAANPIQVGGRALSSGDTAMLQHGDQIRIGGYLLKVECRDEAEGADDDSTLSARLRASRLAAMSAPAPVPRPLAQTTPTSPQPPAPRPLPAAPVSGLSSDNPFADLLGGAPGQASDPFADLLGPSSPPAPASVFASPAPLPRPGAPMPDFLPSPSGVDPRSAAFASPPPPADNRLPDDFDPFGAPAAASRPLAPAEPVDPFADLMPSNAAPSIDQAFGLADATQGTRDPLADFMADLGAPSKSGTASVPTDPLALFGEAPPARPAPPSMPAQSDHLPALHAAYQPPKVVSAPPPAAPVAPPPRPAPPVMLDAVAPSPAPAARPPQAAPRPQPGGPTPAPVRAASPGAAAAAASSRDAEALWAAFCEGAGVQLPLPPGAGEERMRQIGMILRSAVEGTLQLMAVRASTKHELRAAVTMIQQRSNNPLKFSPDAASGIEQLVQPPMRGFLDGPAAMDDAMHDLVGHSIGTVAGMRAAIEGMLGRFDPAELEAKLAGGSMLDSLLPMNRRARLWDLYLQHHSAIREEAQEDFHNLFGKAFLSAYEQQIERLKANKARR